MLDVFMLGVLCLFVLFVGIEIWALVKWKGAWRVAASLCRVSFCLVTGRIAIDISVNPASHNMWPFEIIVWSGLGIAVLGALVVIRLIAVRGPAVP